MVTLAVLFACSAGLSQANTLEEGIKAFESSDYSTAVSLLHPLMKQGNAHVQFYLSVMYIRGQACL